MKRKKVAGAVFAFPVKARLHFWSDAKPGIRRERAGKNFRYRDRAGSVIRDAVTLARIRALAIPPAWTAVWICPDALGHLQATGRDARGRKQYRYHAQWRQVRDEMKYGRLIAFAQTLPRIRQRTCADLNTRGLTRERVLAALVQLLEKTLIRIGNEEYARDNRSYGLTTMRNQHAKIAGACVNFEFRGKSGIRHAVNLHDARLARIVKACRDLPGYELFQYLDDEGKRQTVDSADVNAYLRELSGTDFTAKDFRTWAGTVMAAKALAGSARFRSASEARRNIVRAVEEVAKRLGNTKAVCRRCYIHPAILNSYLEGVTLTTGTTGTTVVPRRARARRAAGSQAALRRGSGPALRRRSGPALSAEEAAVVGLLERRLLKTA